MVTVTRPTFISSMAVTQAQVDSNEATNEALSDYQYYLSRALPVLEKHGVDVHLSNDAVLRWRDSLGTHSLSVGDSGGIVYVFVLPNGRTRALREGVEVDAALLGAARDHFGIPIPVPDAETDDTTPDADSSGQHTAVAAPPDERYSEFAAHVLAADSVLAVAAAVNVAATELMRSSGPDGSRQIGALMIVAGKRMQSLAGDFEASTAPPDLTTLQQQLLAPLASLARGYMNAGSLLAVNCDSERAIGRGCDELALRAHGSRLALAELASLETRAEEYMRARERAQRMLKDKSVVLPDLSHGQ
jgi:hypothetical protein